MKKKQMRVCWAVVLGAASVGGVGCAVEGPSSSNGGATTDNKAPVAATAAVVHASVPLGPEHELQFVEFKPGLTGTVETGRVVQDTPAVTADLRSLSWVDLYRHFGGSGTEVPASMLGAQARAAALLQANAAVRANPAAEGNAQPQMSTPPEAGQASAGNGPHFYNAGEQTWFLNTFCNGAQNCEQGWDWTTMTSDWSISSGSGIAMVGSEGTTNATFTAYYWSCFWSLFTGEVCDWLYFWQGIVVPGHWISMNVSGGSNYIQWQLTGGGSSTQVSSAAKY
jgi:hypothetical protein